MVSQLRNGLAELFALPDGYEILLGNGGTTAFWDAATFGLIERRSQHLSFGEFSSKFAAAASSGARTSTTPQIISSPTGHPPARRGATADVDAYALTHNETSTGVAMDLTPPRRAPTTTQLVLVDATSAAGGLRFDPRRGRRLLLRPPEVPRRPTAACGWRRSRRERSSASSGSRRRTAGCRRSLDLQDRPRQLPQGPDLQHAGAGHDLPRRPAGRVDQRQRRPRVGRAQRCDRSAGHPLRLGRGVDLRHPVRGRARASAATSSPPSTSTTRSTRPRSPRCCGPTASSTPSRYRKLGRNQLRIATVPRHRPRRRRGAHGLHRPRGGRARLTPHRRRRRRICAESPPRAHCRPERGLGDD